MRQFKLLRRAMATLLSVSMCAAMVTPALAVDPDGTVKPDTLAEAKHIVATRDDVPASWQGHIMTYSREGDNIAINVALYNTPASNTFQLRLKYDQTVVEPVDANGRNSTEIDSAEDSGFTGTTQMASIGKVTADMVNESGAAEIGGSLSKRVMEWDTDACTLDEAKGWYSLGIRVKRELPAQAQKYTPCLVVETREFTPPADKDMDFYTVYFKVLPEKTVDYSTFDFYMTNQQDAMGTVTNLDGIDNTYGAYWVGFPAAPEASGSAEITVEKNEVKISGLDVALSGTSTGKTDVDLSAKTDENGVAAFNSVPVGAYTYTVSGTGSGGGKSYTANGTGSITVTEGVKATASFSNVTEQLAAYPLKLKVQNAQGEPLAISGGNVTFGGAAVLDKGTADKTLSFTTAMQGSNLALEVSGLAGYQKTAVSLNLSANGGSLSEIGELKLSNAADGSFAAIEKVGADYVVTLTVKKTATNVTIPLAVDPAAEFTPEELAGLTVTVAPNPGADLNGVLSAELGGESAVFTPNGGGIVFETTGTDPVTVTGIKVTATLPDGAFDLSLGGVGFESTKAIPVTVFTSNGKTIVNVGGTPAINPSTGAVEGVTGGVTGSTGSTEDAKGNSSIDLSGGSTNTPITEGGSITVNGGAVTVPEAGTDGVADLTNQGLSGATDPELSGGLTPTVVTDPIYVVKVERGGSTDAPAFTAGVYLKNAVASAGTFGLHYDKSLFQYASVSAVAAEGMSLREINKTATEAEAEGYVTFNWTVAQGANLDASVTERKIATISFNVIPEMVPGLDSKLSKGTFSAANFTLTAGYKKIMETIKDEEAREQTLATFWRAVGKAGIPDCVKLDDALAVGGGFYQITQDATLNGVPVARFYDVRMDFELPQNFSKLQADFLVQNSTETELITSAQIKVYAKPAEGEFVLAEATPIATLSTDANGRAFAALDAGEYYYTVDHDSYWAYPDGTLGTESDGRDYDTFTIGLNAGGLTVVTTSGNNAAGGGNTVVADNNCISPLMDAKSYHKVALETDKDGTAAAGNNLAVLSGAEKTYNTVDYYFALEPIAGYDWNLQESGSYSDMAAIAAAITVNVYTVDKTGVDENGIYRGDKGADLHPTWDEGRKQFKLAGSSIGGDAVGNLDGMGEQAWFDFLRSGDIVVTMKSDMLTFASYRVTATAGAGGTVAYAAPTVEPPVGDSVKSEDGPVSGTITEDLSSGRTYSGVFTFTPDAGGHVSKVVVNGAQVTLNAGQMAKDAAYRYQFTDVGANQSIVVMFANAEGVEQSNPAVSVTLGDNGGAVLTYTDESGAADQTANVAGGNTVVTTVKAGTGATVQITPKNHDGADTDAPKYVVDSVLVTVNGAAVADAYVAETGKITLTADQLAAGSSASVIVTFKEEGKDSTQFIVDAFVKDGLGNMTPVGNHVYAKGATPTFVLTPEENWRLDKADAIVLITGGATADQSPDAATAAAYTYTMPALTGDARVEITFSEVTVEVDGQIQIQCGTDKVGQAVAPATLTFTRALVPGQTDKTVLEFESDDIVAAGKLLSFAVQLPAGTWTLLVSKQGYLDYTVTAFEVDKAAVKTIYFGDPACKGGTEAGSANAIKPIGLVPGDARGDGLAVDYGDIGMVAAGWLTNALPMNRTMGDVDESNYTGIMGGTGGSAMADMTLVTTNLLKYRISETYEDFCPAAETPDAP